MTLEVGIRPVEAPVERPPVKTPQQVLSDAVRLIEEHGWCQRAYRSPDGRLCMLGAISAAMGNPLDRESGLVHFSGSQANIVLQIQVRMARQVGDGNIAGWNDTPGRTVDEVKEVMRRAAE